MSSISNGGISDTSYISGLSNVSYLTDNKSMISGTSDHGKNGPMDSIEEDLVGSESYISPEMIQSR